MTEHEEEQIREWLAYQRTVVSPALGSEGVGERYVGTLLAAYDAMREERDAAETLAMTEGGRVTEALAERDALRDRVEALEQGTIWEGTKDGWGLTADFRALVKRLRGIARAAENPSPCVFCAVPNQRHELTCPMAQLEPGDLGEDET